MPIAPSVASAISPRQRPRQQERAGREVANAHGQERWQVAHGDRDLQLRARVVADDALPRLERDDHVVVLRHTEDLAPLFHHADDLEPLVRVQDEIVEAAVFVSERNFSCLDHLGKLRVAPAIAWIRHSGTVA